MGIFCKARRRAAARVALALWIFALGVSIAHACGLGDAFDRAGMGRAAAASSYHAPDEGTLPECDRFCTDDTPLLTKLKSVEDPPTGIGPLITAPAPHRFWRAPAKSVSLVTGPDAPAGIAVNTRFVRLAL